MELKNPYFELSNQQQRKFQINLGIYSLIIVVVITLILLSVSLNLSLLLPLVIGIVITLIAPFFDVPSLVEKGGLKYYSLFLLAEKEKKGIIKIHGGTLFDYYFVLSKNMNGQERTKLILLEYLKGLINLIKEEEENIIIEGTSYIINERTANKVGLKKVSTNGLQWIILAFNYINLMTSISMAKKTIQFPNLNKVNTYRAKVIDIKKKEQFINRLILKLENTNAN
jgi:hypothetical protein